jgi:hypothetical protein
MPNAMLIGGTQEGEIRPRQVEPRRYLTTLIPETKTLESTILPDPIEVLGRGRVLLDDTYMVVDRPYTYPLEGHWFAAVRRADGRVDFFAVPD